MAGAPTPSALPSVFQPPDLSGLGIPAGVPEYLSCANSEASVDINGDPTRAVCTDGYNPEDSQWEPVPNHQNVLILPDLRKPRGPLVAQSTKGVVQEIDTMFDCMSSNSPGVADGWNPTCCYAHDSVSGFWVQFSFGCDPKCDEDSIACSVYGGCLEGRCVCGGTNDGQGGACYMTQELIDGYLAKMPPEFQIPAWASGGESPVWDAWTQGCCGGPVVPTNLTDDQNPNTPPDDCPEGSHLPPCLEGECFSANGCCAPCDPPLPYNNSGPLIGGGLGGGLGGINQDALQPVPTPLSTPLPTQSIAVTACKECSTYDEEIFTDELE